MEIFGYLFKKGHFKGSSEKRAHQQKIFGGTDDPPAPLLQRACTWKIYFRFAGAFLKNLKHLLRTILVLLFQL